MLGALFRRLERFPLPSPLRLSLSALVALFFIACADFFKKSFYVVRVESRRCASKRYLTR